MIRAGTWVETHGPYRIPQSQYSDRRIRSTTRAQIPYSHPTRPPQIPAKQYRQKPYARRHKLLQNMEALNPDEMEAFQRLSDHYQPDLQGPLVGEKLPMNVLVREYEQADPRFVAKTEALAATHSAYRSIKGDGQCGWRAAVFGYFEVLLKSGDLHKIEQERARLRAFDATMRTAGIQVDILEDMFDYSYELLDRIKAAIEVGDGTENSILQTMNNEGDSSCILYHFKSMTSSFMQLNLNDYEPFMEMPMAEYRQQRIDPANQEIDQIGLQALTDGVIAPAGMAVDVSYLDRSDGNEVTPHQFVPDAAGWPTIRLLYRPGHYDMIYQNVQTAVPSGPPIQVNVLSHIDNHSEPFYLAQPTPGDLFALLSPTQSVWQEPVSSGGYQPLQNQPLSMPRDFNSVYPDQYPAEYPYVPTESVRAMEPTVIYEQSWSDSGASSIIPAVAPPPIMRPSPPREESADEPKIRRNNYSLLVYNHPFPALDPELPPGSSSTSHFNDLNFEPEQYKPEVSRKKSSSKPKKGSS